MKVAVCLNGQPRTWKRTIEHLYENLIRPFSADVFLHTWDTDSCETEELVSSYQPVRHLVDKDNCLVVKSYERETLGWSTYSTISGFRSLWLADCLRRSWETQNHFTYDWVVRIRFDYQLKYRFELGQLDNRMLYVPLRHGMDHSWNQGQLYPRIVCDQFAFSNSVTMSIYSNVYLNIDHFYQQGNSPDCCGFDATVINGEHLLAKQLDVFGLRDKIRFVPVSPIIR
jgi:hypothetical protein